MIKWFGVNKEAKFLKSGSLLKSKLVDAWKQNEKLDVWE